MVMVRFGVKSADVAAVVAGVCCCGCTEAAGAGAATFAFEADAVFVLSAGFVGAKKYVQPNSTTIDKSAATMKRN